MDLYGVIGRERSAMSVVSVINYKGGVGKTTVVANISAELAYRGYNVLAIDLDPQANLTFSFLTVDEWQQFQGEKTIKYWFDGFIDREELGNLSDLVITPARINELTEGSLDIICSHLGLINVDLELAVMLSGASPRQTRNNFIKVYSLLLRGLESIKEDYDIVLIDCPPNFNIVTKNALVASDYYLVPAKPDFLSTLGIAQLNRHVDELTSNYNVYARQYDDEVESVNPDLMGIIFTMVGIRNNNIYSAQQQYVAEVIRTGLPIFNTSIRENKTVYAGAPEYGVPVVLGAASGATYDHIREELEDLADEIIGKVGL
jgi:chromosome partitioning protein